MGLAIRYFCLFFFFSASQVFSQSDCKVLIHEISGQYIGKCKKGFAHGKGLAIGIDRYEGSFKTGYPDGRGTYTWANGEIYDGQWEQGKRNGVGEFTYTEDGKVAFKSGIWEDDKYMGPLPEKPKIISSTSIERYSFQRQGDGNQITINLFINGSNNSGVEDFSILTSSGTPFISGNSQGVQSIVFPLTCKVSYYSWNKMHTSKVYSRFEFQIEQAGRWVLDLHNN